MGSRIPKQISVTPLSDIDSESEPDSDIIDPALDEIYRQEPRKTYDLRERKGSPDAPWLDQDRSGTYHPTREKLKNKLQRKKPKSRSAPTSPAARRRFKTCTHCRELKIDCSLKEWTDEPPCEACGRHMIPCTFKNVRKIRSSDVMHSGPSHAELDKPGPSNAKTAQPKLRGMEPGLERLNTDYDRMSIDNDRTRQLSVDQTTENEDDDDDDEDAGCTSTSEFDEDGAEHPVERRTGLSHPVKFYCAQSKCSWCKKPSYGIHYPLWQEKALLQSNHAMTAVREIADGNRAEGIPASKMCKTCVMERLYIMYCGGKKGHDVLPIRENSEGGPLRQNMDDMEAQFDRMNVDQPLSSDCWCSLCPTPAMYWCKRQQRYDVFQRKIGSKEPARFGCGLMLCEICLSQLKRFSGDMDKMIEWLYSSKRDKSLYASGPRKDAELLYFWGLLANVTRERTKELESESSTSSTSGNLERKKDKGGAQEPDHVFRG